MFYLIEFSRVLYTEGDIMKSIKEILLGIIILSIIFSSTFQSSQVLAEESQGSTNQFTDVGEGNWANKYIDRMNLRGVVTGYGDNTFKPNQGINQAEAVTMMIRFLGYSSVDEEFERLELDEESTLFNYVYDVPSWAKGSVAVAYQQKLIDKESAAGFEPFKEASRAWIAKLLVDSVKKRGSLLEITELTTFTDDNEIPDWSYYAINEAVKAKITTGNPDGTFQPNKTVTRAELTAFLYRAERYVDNEYLKNVVRGTVEQKREDSIILNLENDELKRYYFTVNPTIYLDYDKISTSDIQVGDMVSTMVDRSGKIIFLDVLEGLKRESSNQEGTIYLVDHSRLIITIEDSQGALHSYRIADDLVVTHENVNVEVSKLNIMDKVGLEVKGDQVLKVDIIQQYQQERKVDVISFNEEEKILTVRDQNNELAVYSLNDNIRITDLKGNPETMNSIKTGNKVSLKFENDRLESIEIARYSINGATLNKIVISTKTIDIEFEKEKRTLDLSPDVTVKINGYANASLNDFYVNDTVNLKVEDNMVVDIEVLNRSRGTYVFEILDSAAKMIKVKSVEDYSKVQYLTYREHIVPTRGGNALTSIASLTVNDRIDILIIDGLIQQIEIATYDSGSILEINNQDKYIKIRNSNNKEVYYNYTELTNVTSNNIQYSADKLVVGDSIRYYIIDGMIADVIKY